MKFKAIGIIPARYGSTRLAAKVLADIGGKPMIQHVWERASKAKLVSEVIVACDDQRIIDACKKFGAKAVMTSPNHQSGTDRIAEVAAKLDAEIVLNIQGDEPLVDGRVIDGLVQSLLDDPKCQMSTPIRRMTNPEELPNPNVVKVVIDDQGYALYFSRSPIPFNRDYKPWNEMTIYKHFGLYAYRKNFLKVMTSLPPSYLEQMERLEQLRVMQAGYKIKTVITDCDMISVDTAEDLKRVQGVFVENK